MQNSPIEQIFDKPKVCSIVGDSNSGKSNFIYYLILSLRDKKDFNLVTYGLRNKIPNSKEIFSITELEQITDSVIFLDEFFTLFDLENKNKRKQIENTLRLIFHNNNVLILVGLPENFRKFLASKIEIVFYKKSTLGDFINGTNIKRIIFDYQGSEMGSSVLNLGNDEALVYNKGYQKWIIPYLKNYDTKLGNKPILKDKKIIEKIEKVDKKEK